MTKNGRSKANPARRHRTPSHEPPPREPDEVAPGADDGATGLPGAPSTTDPNGRDDLGRFGPGNAHSRGHAGHRKVSEMRRAALEAETPVRVARVMAKLFDLAEAGDVSAAKVYLENVVGRPIQGVEISGPDGSPLERSAELATALGAALSPFSEEVRFAVLGVIKRAVHAERAV